jgi:DNA-binding transcriptional regulator YiaG
MAKHITGILDDALAAYDMACDPGVDWSLGEEVQILRRRLGLSQVAFSETYDIPLGTLQNWEQAGRRTRPDAAARLLIKMIKEEPKEVAELVRRTRKISPAVVPDRAEPRKSTGRGRR